jgi:hypothetical protein
MKYTFKNYIYMKPDRNFLVTLTVHAWTLYAEMDALNSGSQLKHNASCFYQ